MERGIILGTDIAKNNDITITNCPNCGGVLHDCICDYCGTVVSNDIDNFVGKTSLLISVDDDGNIIFGAIDVREVSRENEYDTFYTSNTMYNALLDERIDIRGCLTDSPTNMHELRKLRDILNSRLKNF